MNGDMPIGQFNTVAAERFAAQVEALTDGTIKISFHPACSLFTDELAPGALASGAIELAQMGIGGEIEALVPEVLPLAGPSYTDMDWFYRFMYDKDGGGGWAEAIVEPAYARANIKWLASLPYAPEFAVMTNKEVTSVDDYEGLKLRASGKSYAAFMEGTGAKPLVMSSSDVYMAIQRGTIDGGVSGATTFISRKWYEVADYCQTLGAGPHSLTLVANLDFWNSLTADQQAAIMKAAKATEIWTCEQALADHEKCLAELTEKGVEVFRFEVGEPEWERLMVAGEAPAEAILKQGLGEYFAETMQMLEATKDGTMTWREAIEASMGN